LKQEALHICLSKLCSVFKDLHSSLALASDSIILSKLFVDVKNNFEKLFL